MHVTIGLASLPGKLEEYVDLEREGLTAIELDVKDENGQVGFTRPAMPLANATGAARDFFDARQAVRLVHDRGLYLVGRVVVFEDPVLAYARPDLAVRRRDGTVWRDGAGLGWTNPYDRRVWRYNVDVAVAAAKAGFDEILFDYVRFPVRRRCRLRRVRELRAHLPGAMSSLVSCGTRTGAWSRSGPVSAAVFGLSAARDLGIGQTPRRMVPYLDAVYRDDVPVAFRSRRAFA